MADLSAAEEAILDTYGQGDKDRARRIVAALRPHLYREVADRLETRGESRSARVVRDWLDSPAE